MDRNELIVTAELAQLALEAREMEKLTAAVTQMLEYFSLMDSIDVSGLEPTTHALLKHNRLREDKVSGKDISDSILDSAPELEGRFIVIPNGL